MSSRMLGRGDEEAVTEVSEERSTSTFKSQRVKGTEKMVLSKS
jgi:hypothetical protein